MLLVLAVCHNVQSEVVIHTAPVEEKLVTPETFKLTNIFTRKITKWSTNGARIIVFIRPINSIEHKLFVMRWLGVTNYRYKKLLQQNTFSGAASNVKIIISDEQMMITIKSTPNSIGYVGDSTVLNDDSKITIITTD